MELGIWDWDPQIPDQIPIPNFVIRIGIWDWFFYLKISDSASEF